jgi:MoxR-like ATPase
MRADIERLTTEVQELAPSLQAIRDQVARVVVGQRGLVDRLLIGLLANGHLLLEGVPGLAKTTAVNALADALDVQFSRIQFTPDLLPADVLGTQIYDPRETAFRIHRGPIFANIVLADEINRAPAKVQSALLEAMQERQVTIGPETFALPRPFLVLATQNPIEQEGTYPLPEAQTDRFMMKLRVGYPTRDEELEILARAGQGPQELEQVCTPAQLTAAQDLTRRLHMEPVVQGYAVDLVRATRDPASAGLAKLAPLIEFGASPRATLALSIAGRAHALLDGRAFVTPDDIKAIAPDVLRHRMLLSYEAEAQNWTSDRAIAELLLQVPTP